MEAAGKILTFASWRLSENTYICISPIHVEVVIYYTGQRLATKSVKTSPRTMDFAQCQRLLEVLYRSLTLLHISTEWT